MGVSECGEVENKMEARATDRHGISFNHFLYSNNNNGIVISVFLLSSSTSHVRQYICCCEEYTELAYTGSTYILHF